MVAPQLTIERVLSAVDSHKMRTGQWPTRDDGVVADYPEISWGTIDRRLRTGQFGLSIRTTLSKWLREVRGVWDGGKPRLTPSLVLRWAERHYARYGRWPVTLSGPLFHQPDENWAAIDVALRNARRGFPSKTSLSQLIEQKVGERYRRHIGMPKEHKPQLRAKYVSVSRG